MLGFTMFSGSCSCYTEGLEEVEGWMVQERPVESVRPERGINVFIEQILIQIASWVL